MSIKLIVLSVISVALAMVLLYAADIAGARN